MPILPLFPLSMVVVPGEPVPLHIFEERYKQLIADCAPTEGDENYKPFGLPYSQKDKLNTIACTVLVDEILHSYPSGELDIMTFGHQRFRILEVIENSQTPYIEAQVEWLLETPLEISTSLKNEVLELYQAFLRAVEVEDTTLDENAEQLSFEIAYRVNLEKQPKLELLEAENEVQRLTMMRDYLNEAVPTIVQAKDFRQRVRSNGYFA